VANRLILLFPPRLRLVSAPNEQEARFRPNARNTHPKVCHIQPRLGHAASIVRRGNRRGQIISAACRVLEPRPTNAVEDEDDDEYEDDF